MQLLSCGARYFHAEACRATDWTGPEVQTGGRRQEQGQGRRGAHRCRGLGAGAPPAAPRPAAARALSGLGRPAEKGIRGARREATACTAAPPSVQSGPRGGRQRGLLLLQCVPSAPARARTHQALILLKLRPQLLRLQRQQQRRPELGHRVQHPHRGGGGGSLPDAASPPSQDTVCRRHLRPQSPAQQQRHRHSPPRRRPPSAQPSSACSSGCAGTGARCASSAGRTPSWRALPLAWCSGCGCGPSSGGRQQSRGGVSIPRSAATHRWQAGAVGVQHRKTGLSDAPGGTKALCWQAKAGKRGKGLAFCRGQGPTSN